MSFEVGSARGTKIHATSISKREFVRNAEGISGISRLGERRKLLVRIRDGSVKTHSRQLMVRSGPVRSSLSSGPTLGPPPPNPLRVHHVLIRPGPASVGPTHTRAPRPIKQQRHARTRLLFCAPSCSRFFSILSKEGEGWLACFSYYYIQRKSPTLERFKKKGVDMRRSRKFKLSQKGEMLRTCPHCDLAFLYRH